VNIVGISGFYHDSAAAIVQDGELVAAAQEERFTRRKHDPDFPANALSYCLEAGNVEPDGIDAVVFYDKPLTTFVRLLRTYLRAGPRGISSFREAMPLWLRQKLWIPYEIERNLIRLGFGRPADLYFIEHHESHAASAFFASPFDEAAILTFDGVGEWATASIGLGRANTISIERQLSFPHSLGLLYSAFTHYCGFRVNSGEYKLMGLAPYGDARYVDLIREHLVDLHRDGSFEIDSRFFGYLGGRSMTNKRFHDLFGGPPREPEAEITQREMDLARSIQEVTEEIVLQMARFAATLTGQRRACLAGGVALNCVANGRLWREGPFDELWIQPAAGDAGGAIGAALYGWHQIVGRARHADGRHDRMQGAALGPRFEGDEISAWLSEEGLPFSRLSPTERAIRIAELIAAGNIVGHFEGRMEFGPRALGHRSILGDPRDPGLQSRMNLKIKYRESFRPFAPAVLLEHTNDWFDLDIESPYMMVTAQVSSGRRHDPGPSRSADLTTRVNQRRSEVPAVTHVDGSARVQTVSADQMPAFHAVLVAFEQLTGCPVLVNTSMNVRGEPIACTPADAFACFARTEMDALVLEDCLLLREDQPAERLDPGAVDAFALD